MNIFDSVLTINHTILFFEDEPFNIEQSLTYFEFSNILVNCGLLKNNSMNISLEQKLSLFFSQLLNK